MPEGSRSKVIDLDEVKSRLGTAVSCCIIARDEEETIADAISSVKDLADEVIVVDTGSCDRTVLFAKQSGATVYHAAWEDDFSDARNLSLSKAASSWILVLDADETLDADGARRIRQLISSRPDSAFLFDQWTYTNGSGGTRDCPAAGPARPDTFISRQVRLFPNGRDIVYRGKVHEGVSRSLEEQEIPVVETDIVIHHHGRLKGSQRVYRKVDAILAAGPGDVEVSAGDARYVYELAALLFECRRLDEAAAHAERGLALEPDNWEFSNILGLSHLLMNRLDDAEACFRRALERAGAECDIHNNLGVTLVEEGRLEEAIRCFEAGIESCGKSANMTRNLASACCGLGLVERALSSILDSIEIDPFVAMSHVVHAEILFRRGDRGGASKALERMRFISDISLKVFLRAIHLYARMDMIGEAEEIFSLARQSFPDHEGLVYLSGKIAEMKGEDGRALSVYHSLLPSRPDDADLHNSIGCVYERLGEYGRAIRSFVEAKRLDPVNVQIEINLGILMGRIGKNREAEIHLRRAVGMQGESAAAFNALGCHLANQGRYEEAVLYFDRAAGMEPTNVAYLLNLGMAYEQADLPDRALEVYEKVTELDPRGISVELIRRLAEPVP